MADFKGKLKNWLGNDPEKGPMPSEKTAPQTPDQDRPILIDKPLASSAEIPPALIQHRDEARKKLSELSEEMSRARKNLEVEFRKKSEERIRLFAQLSHSDSQAQALLEQERSKFYKAQKEYESEIETLESTLKNETLRWHEALQEQDQYKAEFVKGSDFKIQEKELDRKRREQELEKSVADLKSQIAKITEQMEREQKQWAERIRAESDEIISLKTQLELREANRKSQEQKLQQDLLMSSQQWDSKIQALESQINRERQKWQEDYVLKESELRAIKLEHDRKESMIRLTLKAKEDEILAARSRAESKLKAIESEMKRLKSQNGADLRERAEQAEKMRVELMLLDSQFKVDSEKVENALNSLQKEAVSKISFLERKLQDELRSGQKTVGDKLAEIQGMEMEAAVRKKQLEDEFNQKKSEAENQRADYLEKLKLNSKIIEDEKDHHRKELSKRDEMILALKSQMTKNAEEMKAKRDAFANQLEVKKREIEADLAQLEEKSKLEKQQILDVLSARETALSDKKAALIREQASLHQAMKAQEDQLLLEIQPLRHQLQDLKTRLEQDRATRQKLILTKEDILNRLHAQELALEEANAEELKTYGQSFAQEEQKAEARLRAIQETWRKEKAALEQSIQAFAKEAEDVERKMSVLPLDSKSETEAILARHQEERTALEKALEEARRRIAEETDHFNKTLEHHEKEEQAARSELQKLNEKAAYERKFHQESFDVERSEFERKMTALQSEIHGEKTALETDLKDALETIEKLNAELGGQKTRYETEKTAIAQAWTTEQTSLTHQIASIEKEFESQKSIWDKALEERSTQSQNIRREVEQTGRKLAATLSDYERKKRIAGEEFQKTLRILENQRGKAQADFEQKIKEKKGEVSNLQKRLEEFLVQSQAEHSMRSAEIAQTKVELKKKLSTVKSEIERESQRWPQALSNKDSEISGLKNDLALKEASFRSDWEKADKDFEEFKKKSSEKIQSLQKTLQEERSSSEIRLKDLETQIKDLQDLQAKEAELSKEASAQMEGEFHQTRTSFETDIAEHERKIDLERKRAEQQIKVKEMEIAALQRDLEQREIQRAISTEARKKEIDQERTRLLDWQRALEARLQKERNAAEMTFKAKEDELSASQEKVRLQRENLENEHAARRQEILETKTRLEIRVKELSRTLQDATRAQNQTILAKGGELQEITNKLNLWNETVRLEGEQEELKWQKGKQAIEEEIHRLQSELESERTALDQKIQKQSEEIGALNRELAHLQQEHFHEISEFKRQKSEIQAEEEMWENKLKEEKSRLSEEARSLDRAIERIKVQISLKETQAAIEKQKREREVLWSRRPFESKLADLKRKYEDKEKEMSRRSQTLSAEKERLLEEIKKFEAMAGNEHQEREAALAKMKQSLQARLKEVKAHLNQDEAWSKETVEQRKEELKALQKSLSEIESATKNPLVISMEDLKAEIASWEKKLEALPNDDASAEGKAEVRELQRKVIEKKKIYDKKKRETDDILSHAENEAEKVSKALNAFEQRLERLKGKPFESRAHMEAGFSAFAGGNYREALASFDQALVLDPQSAVAHQMQGLLYEKLGQYGAAHDSFKKALELDPTNEFLKRHIGEKE